MTKTIIRRAVGADFPALLSIDQVCFPPGIAYDSDELAWFMSRKGAETLVLEEDGQIAAFLILQIHRRRKLATIITLDVQPDQRRRKYASSLLQRSEEIVRSHGVELYELQVDTENTAAITFYLKHGFRTGARLSDYYSNGHDAYVMTKRLRQASAG
jgi:ribosomal-protein-alanine N-acetyltransferase